MSSNSRQFKEREDPDGVLVMAAKMSRAAEELKDTLSLDEAGFRIMAPQAHRSSRDYFVFEALDEVQKAVVSIFQAHELVSGEVPDPEAALARIAAESAGDEIALWQRKLIETLADLIGFSATPEDPHFRDCLLHADLDQQLSAQRDLLRSYGAESLNLAHQIDETVAEIKALEADGLDPSNGWYRRHQAPFELAKLGPGRVLASFSRRFDHAVALASDGERAGLGFSYAQGFGRTSQSIHARPGGLELVVDMPGVMSDINATIAIALSVLTRSQRTVGAVPAGENEWFRALEDNNDFPASLRQNEMRGKAAVGDVVMAHDLLAQVLEIAEGESGNRSYRVRYLSRPPLPQIPEDWHIAQHVKVVLDPERTREMVRGQANQHPGQGIEKLNALSDERLMAAIAESIAASEMAGGGMREAILAEAAKRRAASHSEN